MSDAFEEKCPECRSANIQVIDHPWNEEEMRREERWTCWDCDHDWHTYEEGDDENEPV